jgi:hypothetical protein
MKRDHIALQLLVKLDSWSNSLRLSGQAFGQMLHIGGNLVLKCLSHVSGLHRAAI